ncbi:MAG TPA: DNA methyltransferase [bacterium]|jgi:putative DNA methylase|nr:DNA methyltransferase [bacterium]
MPTTQKTIRLSKVRTVLEAPPRPVNPMGDSGKALPHRPVYGMHRYFARRPYSIFAAMVSHYSQPGDVILDPFCGGGVTLVEGILQKRRVIGFDLNPIATYVTKMELSDVDLEDLDLEVNRLVDNFKQQWNYIFSTPCRTCKNSADALWFEYSSVTECAHCSHNFSIIEAAKVGPGTWTCPQCKTNVRFSQRCDTPTRVVNVMYSCKQCGEHIHAATQEDQKQVLKIENTLSTAEKNGLWIPNEKIPDCNMQRESALFKKGIVQFRQLFTPRTLFALANLKQMILKAAPKNRDWLLFIFSSTLRYTNKMVTRNEGWRGNRPLEWAKPGYWLPPVFLDSNVIIEFERRYKAVTRGKKDYLAKLDGIVPLEIKSAKEVMITNKPAYHVSCQSSTKIPLADGVIDVILTDPPYGSYVHYADLCNFWAVWFPELAMGKAIDNREEAVIARKRFPGAKDANDYQELLRRCFSECARVLRPGGYMVLTFNNREPRAWGALLVAAAKAGFDLPKNGVIFQDGIENYRQTAQSRRAGSVIGDFVFSFLKNSTVTAKIKEEEPITEQRIVEHIRTILMRQKKTFSPNDLMRELYIEIQPALMKRVRYLIGQQDNAVARIVEELDTIKILDSHRRNLLEQHFNYKAGLWSLRGAHV